MDKKAHKRKAQKGKVLASRPAVTAFLKKKAEAELAKFRDGQIGSSEGKRLVMDGKALAVIAYVKNAMKQNSCLRHEVVAYVEDAKSGDYAHLLQASDEMIEKLKGGSVE